MWGVNIGAIDLIPRKTVGKAEELSADGEEEEGERRGEDNGVDEGRRER